MEVAAVTVDVMSEVTGIVLVTVDVLVVYVKVPDVDVVVIVEVWDAKDKHSQALEMREQGNPVIGAPGQDPLVVADVVVVVVVVVPVFVRFCIRRKSRGFGMSRSRFFL